MTATEGRIKPQSIGDDVTRVVAELRQALRPIESPYGESTGGPDGWSPEPDEIREWEMTFQEHATPANVAALLAALTLVQAERDAMQQERDELRKDRDLEKKIRKDYVDALEAMREERDELRAALDELVFQINAAGLLNLARGVELGSTVWYVKASNALNAAEAVLTPKATQENKHV